MSIVVELEEFAVDPDIGAVESHVDRQVAHDANVVAGAMRLQIAPLALEFKLEEFVAFDLVAQSVARAGEGSRLTQRQFAVPFRPDHQIVSLL